ncbi:MAG: PD-(D/E)XK nuclease family transposase [Candidatus Riflebacteria bacterium]|nr:PD-(D/E)XK nuclease family transposase [Candidatus Riflebacteria bacterium]
MVQNKSRINRMNDYFFKRIFGSEENKDILLSFLNSILAPDGKNQLTCIELLNREIDPEFIFDKSARLDILGKTNSNELIDIEVQVCNEGDNDSRPLFYWAKLFSGQLKSGSHYQDLKRTIVIAVLNHSFIKTHENYHSSYQIYDVNSQHVLTDLLSIHFLELPKMRTLQKKPRTLLEKWLMYLCNTEGEAMDAIAENEPQIQKALTCEEIFQKVEKDRLNYEMREKALLDYSSALASAEQRGKNEGKVETAKNLLSMNLSLEDVAKATGLSIEEIRKLGH